MHPGHTRHPTPNRAPANPAKPPPATHITFQPATPAKSDTLRHFKSINRHSLSASATPCQPQSVSPLADRHPRLARGCIERTTAAEGKRVADRVDPGVRRQREKKQ